jgi:hypothetical protein
LESHCYNESCPGPMLSTSLRYDDRKPFLIVLNPCLTFLRSACISFTSQPSVFFNSRLSLSHIVVGSQVPSYHGICSLLSHVIMISNMTSCPLFELSKRMSSSTAPDDRFSLMVLTSMKDVSHQQWNFRKFILIQSI